MNFFVVAGLIFVVAVLMTMVGKGGGNFYVVILAMASVPMHEAAATGQFILFSASAAAMVIFSRNKTVSWKLALLIGTFTALSALAGGYYSHLFSNFALKLIFAVMLIIAGAIMLLPPADRSGTAPVQPHLGTLALHCADQTYHVNLWLAVPVTMVTGFASGMVGVSGGSFLVPLMVLACGVSMHTAVGTASTLIAATACMGFAGHAARGDFNPSWAVPLAFITIVGGIIGGRFALQSKPRHLKQLFAYTNWLAAGVMIFNAFHYQGP